MQAGYETLTQVVPEAFWKGWGEYIAREVKRLPGILEVTFDLRSKVATVTFNPQQVSADQISKAIEKANADMAPSGNAQEAQISLLLEEKKEGERP